MDRLILCGMDENGLGPRLGPLVVTAAWARTTPEGRAVVEKKRRKPLARLGDSKALVRFGDSALGEAWARAILSRLGVPARTPAEALRALCLDEEEHLRARCPEDHAGQCWAVDEEHFEASEALVARVGKDLGRLAERGIDVVGARVALVCNERLNEAAARGVSRFTVDLHAMERLALAVTARERAEVGFTCGKVGGFDRYASRFGPLAGYLHTALQEGRARSEYKVPGVGTLAFVRDADATHLLVSMASLVGKWARDLVMQRIVRWHRRADATLPFASGYHDPVTTRFISATALARRASALPEVCFERSRAALLDDVSGAATSPAP